MLSESSASMNDSPKTEPAVKNDDFESQEMKAADLDEASILEIMQIEKLRIKHHHYLQGLDFILLAPALLGYTAFRGFNFLSPPSSMSSFTDAQLFWLQHMFFALFIFISIASAIAGAFYMMRTLIDAKSFKTQGESWLRVLSAALLPGLAIGGGLLAISIYTLANAMQFGHLSTDWQHKFPQSAGLTDISKWGMGVSFGVAFVSVIALVFIIKNNAKSDNHTFLSNKLPFFVFSGLLLFSLASGFAFVPPAAYQGGAFLKGGMITMIGITLLYFSKLIVSAMRKAWQKNDSKKMVGLGLLEIALIVGGVLSCIYITPHANNSLKFGIDFIAGWTVALLLVCALVWSIQLFLQKRGSVDDRLSEVLDESLPNMSERSGLLDNSQQQPPMAKYYGPMLLCFIAVAGILVLSLNNIIIPSQLTVVKSNPVIIGFACVCGGIALRDLIYRVRNFYYQDAQDDVERDVGRCRSFTKKLKSILFGPYVVPLATLAFSGAIFGTTCKHGFYNDLSSNKLVFSFFIVLTVLGFFRQVGWGMHHIQPRARDHGMQGKSDLCKAVIQTRKDAGEICDAGVRIFKEAVSGNSEHQSDHITHDDVERFTKS